MCEHAQFIGAFTLPLITTLVEHFRLGGSFATITEARAFAAASLGQPVLPGSAATKELDEAIEAALVRVAQSIVTGASPQTAYRHLVALHDRQPALNVRSSTSVAQQAYSTPLPLAYLASVLAEVDASKTVYEPSAGHGALLLGGGNATVNELNPDRAADLRAQGYTVTEADAAVFVPDRLHDVVIANPPFGTVPGTDGQNKTFTLPQFTPYRTTQIDHAIALNALQAMKADGRAVLILGGKLGVDEDKRSDRYNSQETRAFYYTLYQQFGVVDHFSVWGDLYKKQGAGFPIDLIVIQGRGKSTRPLPAAEVPRLYRSFTELEELLDAERRHAYQSRFDSLLRTSGTGTPLGSLGTAAGNEPERTTLSGIVNATVAGIDSTTGGGIGGSRDLEPAARPHLAAGDSVHTAPTPGQLDQRLGTSAGLGKRPAADPDQPVRDQLSGFRGTAARPERVAEGIVLATRGAEPGGMADGTERDAGLTDKPKQVPYHPHSQGRSVNTLVPVNMQTAANQALVRLSRQVGDIDQFVTDRLGYGSPQTLHQYFSAEQVDALALAIHNIERGSGFILGDQTGIGKGRVVAGMLRYAQITGRTPIFVTKDPTLYPDMVRDLQDIGMRGFTPLVTNTSLTIGLPDGRTLKTSNQQEQTLRALREEGSLRGYDAIFTTYNQLQTIKGKDTERRAFLKRFAVGSLLVLDESHEAGGGTTAQSHQGAVNRADFTRELVELADGCLYSSATYAKVPEVMTLYAKTDMRLALSNMHSLTGLVASGGIPLQQALAATLTEAGQYLRRERSFEGVQFEPQVAAVNHEVAENIATIMAEIMEFDRFKRAAVKAIDKDLKAEAKQALGDNSTGGAGATSTNFTSIMHNVIDQMLLALKAEATVQQALQLLRQESPEKPVIALSNTMGTVIQRYAEEMALQPGESMALSFGDLLRRYLERSRDILEGSAYGEKKLRRLSNAELGTAAVQKFQRIHTLIDRTDFSQIPVSPVDYILGRLRQEGYRVGEVTGREHLATYQPDGSIRYQRRSTEERSKKTAVETVKAFNEGRLDVILLNRSGSTGISLHASETFTDQRRRHMIVAQAEGDINQFMQMLGRVHRTGQVIPPNFTLLMADIPAEKRPGAVLMKKMASLNANTTAARSSGIALDVPDFMNAYGDQVVEALMANHPDIHERLDYPLANWQGAPVDNAAARVTGRIPLLPLAEQETLYDLIEQKYREFVAQQEALGESVLEAHTLDLEAKILARMEILPADTQSHSPFTGAVYAEVVDAKTPRKPYPTLTVINQVRDRLGLSAVEIVQASEFAQMQQAAIVQAMAAKQTLHQQARAYQAEQPPSRSGVITAQMEQVGTILEEHPIGQAVKLAMPDGEPLYGVVLDVAFVGQQGSNPVAPSSWVMRFLVADAAQDLTFPLSQVNTDKPNSIRLMATEQDEQGNAVYELFDQRQQQSREKRQIITGNLLRGYEKYPGRIVNFTDAHGNLRQGLLTPRDFDAEAFLDQAPVAMPTIEDATRWLTEYHGQLQTSDLALTLKAHRSGGYVLQTARTKSEGGQYFLDEGLQAAAGDEFYSVADRMECRFPEEHLEPVLAHLLRVQGYTLAAFEQREVAREMLGIALPSFETVLELPTEPEVVAVVEEPIAVVPLLAVPSELSPGKQLKLGSEPSVPLQGWQLLENARMLLNQAGQLDVWGQVSFRYKRYECIQEGERLTVQRYGSGKAEVILQAIGDTVLQSTAKPKEEALFAQLVGQFQVFQLQRSQNF